MSADLLLSEAEKRDAADPLREFRSEFHLPSNALGKSVTYLCGHSLGLQPKRVSTLIQEELEDWQRMGVEGHFGGRRPWLTYHERLSTGLATLTGALEQEVVAMNSLSVNLHLLLVSFYRPTPERHKILIERNAFPSDRYAVISQLRLQGFDPADALVEIAPRTGEASIRHDDIYALLEREGSSIATVLLPGVQYLTGQRLDIPGITAAARKQGCVVGFDLAHAIGNVPLTLHASDVDFAVWCGYKYLNGGPGAIGGAFIHQRHARAFDLPRFAGWWGHDKDTRFAMPDTFLPLSGAEGWQISNPPILAMTPLIASLEIFERARLTRLWEKSLQLTQFLSHGIETHLRDQVSILTPTNAEARGAQLSLVFNVSTDVARRIHEHLAAAGIVCDWREPNVLRVALVPLYNTYKEAWTLIDMLRTILRERFA
jgi:kynureninase